MIEITAAHLVCWVSVNRMVQVSDDGFNRPGQVGISLEALVEPRE
jgi:hypothetical protein